MTSTTTLVRHFKPVLSVTDARSAGLAVLASDERLTGVYYDLPFGEVVVVRDGTVYLAEEYDAGLVGRGAVTVKCDHCGADQALVAWLAGAENLSDAICCEVAV